MSQSSVLNSQSVPDNSQLLSKFNFKTQVVAVAKPNEIVGEPIIKQRSKKGIKVSFGHVVKSPETVMKAPSPPNSPPHDYKSNFTDQFRPPVSNSKKRKGSKAGYDSFLID